VRGGYYVLPNANSYSSPTYNKKLFDEKGLYFADSIEELYASSEAPAATDAKYGILLRNKTAKKSCGPDGVYNTVDDGLPSSVEEYKQLVDCMVELGIMPYVAYASTYHYTNKMLLAMWANLEGYEGTKLYIGRDSSYGNTEIISLDSDNNVIMEGGEPKTETLTLETPSASSNGYLIERQASKYYALDFYEHIFGKSNIDKYYDVQGLSSTVSQIDVQRKFVESELGNNTPVAFLMDGTYWENESKDAGEFKHLQKDEPDYYDELDYRVFPLPNQYKGRGEAVGTADENGVITYFDGKSEADVKKQVLVDNLFTGLYVNKAALYGADGKSIDPSTLKITELFIKFIHSDESLSEFTGITGMKKIYDYDISDKDYAKMSDFSKSVIDLGKVSDVLLPVTNTTFNKYNSVVVNMTFQTVEDMFSSKNGKGDQVRWAINGFRSGMSLNEYFKGIAEARDKTWWQGLNF
ncbi:MAG: hypothetical protein J5903_00825, partial [Clostridia bacterium]|nr:hypothetical protein [Clostridia bacterium]